MKKTSIWIIDAVLIVVTLLALIGAVLYGFGDDDVLLAPENYETHSSILFSFKGVSEIMVDDDFSFSTPERYLVFDGQLISMKKGSYYMNLDYGSYHEIRTFALDQATTFVLARNTDGSYSVQVREGQYSVAVLDGTGDFQTSVLLEGTDA